MKRKNYETFNILFLLEAFCFNLVRQDYSSKFILQCKIFFEKY